jgi:hypothetical protein
MMEDKKMDTTAGFRIMMEKLFTKIIDNPIPGEVIDLEPLGKFEILLGRKLSWYHYKTGETEIWLFPDSPNARIADMKLTGVRM